MLAYPSDQEKKDKKEGLPSRSLPTYYIESINYPDLTVGVC